MPPRCKTTISENLNRRVMKLHSWSINNLVSQVCVRYIVCHYCHSTCLQSSSLLYRMRMQFVLHECSSYSTFFMMCVFSFQITRLGNIDSILTWICEPTWICPRNASCSLNSWYCLWNVIRTHHVTMNWHRVLPSLALTIAIATSTNVLVSCPPMRKNGLVNQS